MELTTSSCTGCMGLWDSLQALVRPLVLLRLCFYSDLRSKEYVMTQPSSRCCDIWFLGILGKCRPAARLPTRKTSSPRGKLC